MSHLPRASYAVLLLVAAGHAGATQSPAVAPPLPPTSGPGGTHASPGTSGGPTLGPNLILNGDFESYSGGTCDSNLPNASFTAMMSSAEAFGTADEIDVYENPACFGLDAVSGVRKVAIHKVDSTFGDFEDTFSLTLSSPVVSGETYTLRFFAESDTSFGGALADVLVGLSSSSSSFGTLVYTGSSTVPDTWQEFKSSFVAPIDADFLTVSVDVSTAWAHIDAFSLAPGLGTNYCTANPSSVGSPAGISAAGSSSSSAGDLVLTSTPVPNQAGVFFHGSGPSNIPFGCGNLCTTGGLARGKVVFASGGSASYAYDNSDAKHSLGGEVGTTRHFQHWFRDPANAGACGNTFNLSNAIWIAIAP